jgi:integrase
MKAKVLHVVPLPPRCLRILEEVKCLGDTTNTGLIFPGRHGGPLSDMTFTNVLRDMALAEKATAHGFRTSFRTWAKVDKCREVVAEATLAHVVKDKVGRPPTDVQAIWRSA